MGTNADHQRAWRDRQKAKLASLEAALRKPARRRKGSDQHPTTYEVANSFHSEALAFCADYSNRIGAWLRTNPAMADEDREVLMQGLHQVGNEVSKIAQGLWVDPAPLRKEPACSKCNGTGLYGLQAFDSCGVKKQRSYKTPTFPCPACKPEEYFVASGGELRNQGKYVEALCAALKILDYWSAGDTLIAWGATPREVREACWAAKVSAPGLKFAGDLMRTAKAFPPETRAVAWEHCAAIGSPEKIEAIMNSEEDEGEDDEALTPPLRKPPEPGSLITDDFAAAAGSTEEFPQFDTEDGDTDGKRLLVGQYFAHGRALLQRFPESECAQAALEEFTTRPDPTWLDMVTIMQDAGEEVAGKIFERITDEWIASLPPREPKPEPVVRRRRGKVT